jgi:hypothetical protein
MVGLAEAIEAVRIEDGALGLDILPDLTSDQRAEAERLFALRRGVSDLEFGPTGALQVDPVAPGSEVAPTVAGNDAGDVRVEATEAHLTVDPPDTLARPLSAVLGQQTKPRWLLKDELERGVIALMAGQRGSYKSFKALDWACRVALTTGPVYVVSAEGGDFDRRARAWVMTNAPDPTQLPPLFVVERRLDLNSVDGIKAIREDCLKLGIRPVLFVLDTFSKLSGGLDENDNTQVKQFIGRLDNGLKRADTGFDATVLLVAHTGHSDKGRARGASALGADTDAEYIVRRLENGKTSVTVSRERFKASPELPPLAYEPVIVDLGYVDDDGGKVTSLILSSVDPGGIPAARELRPEHKEALALVYQFLGDGEKEYEDVVRAMAKELPPPVAEEGKPAPRDTRIQIARRRFEVLETRGYIRRRKGVGTNAVSRTSATEAADEEFEEKEQE